MNLSPQPSTGQTNGETTTVRRWRWWIHLALIGGYFVPAIPLALRHVQRQPSLTSSPTGLLIVCAAQIVAFAVVYALGWSASRASIDEMSLPWRPGRWVIPLGILYSIGVRVAIALLVFIIVLALILTRVLTPDSVRQFMTSSGPDVERIVDVGRLRDNPAYFWLSLTLVSFVVAGLREEMWRAGTFAAMRKLWPNIFGGMKGQIGAMLLIAVVFGAAHFQMGLLAMLLASVIGFLLGVIIVVHRSIWPAVFAHGFFDAATFALLPHVAESLRQLH